MLCRGVVAYRAGDSARFTAHMHHEHGAYFDMEFLLAACLMNEEEREAVRSVMAENKLCILDVRPEVGETEACIINLSIVAVNLTYWCLNKWHRSSI